MKKILAMTVQGGAAPIDFPLVVELMAPYDKRLPVMFNLCVQIVNEFTCLQSLIVDIFAEHRFDNWVSQILDMRLINNQHKALALPRRHIIAIPGLYCLLQP